MASLTGGAPGSPTWCPCASACVPTALPEQRRGLPFLSRRRCVAAWVELALRAPRDAQSG
ncbi:hypothetical protein PR202_ga05433 [Eleusine coracana subsp. coracana]|uniref:Uncharacterized protein n=1 Tax=Eleusine coracana subsp. coracana TaxID=191504 RepID=A0AAV5BTI2_ELECO|nr:hypothetical protein PR202_ga04980 [Eleusine coracana subsp. coracana]GJM89261.1 hypothetical protein PR202_ga05433 [Eleusine coracana subsp. coracana]